MKKLTKIGNCIEEKPSTFLCQITKLGTNSQQVKTLTFIIIYVCSNLQSDASFFLFEVLMYVHYIINSLTLSLTSSN